RAARQPSPRPRRARAGGLRRPARSVRSATAAPALPGGVRAPGGEVRPRRRHPAARLPGGAPPMDRLVLTLACLVPLAAAAQDFQQGPGVPARVQRLEGRVLALHGDCALELADTGRPGWEGLGGGGRFYW